jgi:PIN domain nuclease of toxin-antitoxin system
MKLTNTDLGKQKHHDQEQQGSCGCAEYYRADPCDRFIIAAALLQDAPVVTADQRFEPYGVHVLT